MFTVSWNISYCTVVFLCHRNNGMHSNMTYNHTDKWTGSDLEEPGPQHPAPLVYLWCNLLRSAVGIYNTCFAVSASDGLCHLTKTMDRVETPLYSEIDQIHLSTEAQRGTACLPHTQKSKHWIGYLFLLDIT